MSTSLRLPFILYCVIVVLLNGVIALGWVLWREVKLNDKPDHLGQTGKIEPAM